MEEIVERIRSLCKEKGTSITKLEVQLGYANGTIGKWAKGKRKPPLEKIIEVARALETTAEFLMDGNAAEKETTPQTGSGLAESDIIAALDGLTHDQLLAVMARAAELAQKNTPSR